MHISIRNFWLTGNQEELLPPLPDSSTIITDAAQGRWFPGSFCPHFPTLHPVSQWRVKGSLARGMIMRRCYITIRIVITEKNNTCSQWLCWDLECKYEINTLSNSWIVSEATCMVERMCVSMCMSVLVFTLYQGGRKTEGWTSTFKSHRVKQRVCVAHERAREQDPAEMDMLLWLRHPLVWHQDGAAWSFNIWHHNYINMKICSHFTMPNQVCLARVDISILEENILFHRDVKISN